MIVISRKCLTKQPIGKYKLHEKNMGGENSYKKSWIATIFEAGRPIPMCPTQFEGPDTVVRINLWIAPLNSRETERKTQYFWRIQSRQTRKLIGYNLSTWIYAAVVWISTTAAGYAYHNEINVDVYTRNFLTLFTSTIPSGLIIVIFKFFIWSWFDIWNR